MLRRAVIHLDGGVASLSLPSRSRRPRGAGPAESVGSAVSVVESADGAPGTVDALQGLLATARVLGHGRWTDLTVVVETDRVIWDVTGPSRVSVLSQPSVLRIPQGLDVAQDSAVLAGLGLRPEDVVARSYREDLTPAGTAQPSAAEDRCADGRVLIAVERGVVDAIEAAARDRRCAGRVRLELGIVGRLRGRLAAEGDAASEPSIIVDVRRAALTVAVVAGARLRACRTVGVGSDAARTAARLLRVVLRDASEPSDAFRPAVRPRPASPLRLELWGAEGSSAIGRCCAEVVKDA
jgi:hypothetical protein